MGRLPRRAAADALEPQQVLSHRPALVDLAYEIALWHADVVEERLAKFIFHIEIGDRSNGDAGAVHRHQQEADALLLLRLLVGSHEEKNPVGIHRQRGPDLLAVHHPMVTVQHRLGAQRREVGSRIRFGITLAPNVLTGEDLRQVVVPLLLRAVPYQQRPQHGHAHFIEPGTAVALLLLQHDELLAGGDTHAAELARPIGTEPALSRQLLVPAFRVFVVQARRRIANLGRIVRLDEAPHQHAEIVVGKLVEVCRIGFGSCGHRLISPYGTKAAALASRNGVLLSASSRSRCDGDQRSPYC